MSTGNIHISIDPDLHQNFKEIVGKGNVTLELAELMRMRIAQLRGDIEGIDLEILIKEISKLEQEQAKITSEIHQKTAIKREILQKREEKEKKRLENEKKRLENSKKCINCNQLLGENEKKHQFVGGFVCNPCFYNEAGTKIKEWNIPRKVE